jgi:hypothetical protein
MGDRIRKFLVYRFDSECETCSISSHKDIIQSNTTIQSFSVHLGVSLHIKSAKLLPSLAMSSLVSASVIRAAFLNKFQLKALSLPAKLSSACRSCRLVGSAHRCKAESRETKVKTERKGSSHQNDRGYTITAHCMLCNCHNLMDQTKSFRLSA